VSLDLDNQWSYMKIHGDAGWESFPSYLDKFVPHVLKVLDDLDIKITFFVVGQDAALDKNKDILKTITDKGHEIGNHSFQHESWLHLYPFEEIESEVLKTQEIIEKITGQKTIGFRGPGFSWNKDLLEILKKNGYLYDASTLPTYIGPFARMYYFWTSKLTKEERKARKGLFGTFKDGLRPIKPYLWELNGNNHLLEIPVSTIPIIKIPFHLSYLLYLSGYSIAIMRAYLKMAIGLCRLTKTEPSFLLHPLDLIGSDELPEMSFFPGMNISSSKKVEVFSEVITTLAKNFNIVNMSEHAGKLLEKPVTRKRKTEK
ncbi:polysaccharide deacetylase family protein, partial [candidate division KSB1 bacterium]